MDDNGRKEDTNNFDVSELQFSISTTINETDEEAEGTSNEAEGTSNEAEGTSNEAEGASTEAEGTTEAEGISIEAESTATKSTTTTKVVRRTVRIIAKDKFEWYEILYKKLLILKASKQDDLIDFLDQYLFKIRIQTLSCSTKPRLAMTLSKNITNMLHLVKERNVRFGMNPSYLFKVSEVMAVYIDMELKASTRGLEAGYLVANRIIFNLESHLEAFDDTFIIESFLRITRHWKTHKEIINMLLSRYLYRSNTTATIYPDRIFLTYMILFKKWRDMTIHSVDKNRIANKFVYFIKPMNSIRNCKYTCYLPDLSLQQDVSKYLITVKFFIEQLMRALKEPDESEPPTVEIINIDENIMNVPSNRDKLRRCSSNANVLSSRSTSPESGVMLEDINKPSTSRCILSSNTDPIASSSKSDFPKPNSTVKKENIDSLECIDLTVEDDDITNGEFNYDWLEILTTRARDNLMMPPRSLPQSRKENRKNIEIIDLDDSDDETEVTPSNNLVSPLEPLDSVSANINQEAHTSLVDCQTKIGTNDLNNDKEIIKNKIPVEYTDTNIELNENANIGCLLNETVKGDITLAQTDNKIIEEKKNIDRNVLEKCNNEDISVKYSQIDTINKETENSSSMEVDETNITLVKESDQPKNNIPNCKAISENQIFQNDPDPDVSLDGLDEQTIVDKAVSAGIVESTETTSINCLSKEITVEKPNEFLNDNFNNNFNPDDMVNTDYRKKSVECEINEPETIVDDYDDDEDKDEDDDDDDDDFNNQGDDSPKFDSNFSSIVLQRTYPVKRNKNKVEEKLMEDNIEVALEDKNSDENTIENKVSKEPVSWGLHARIKQIPSKKKTDVANVNNAENQKPKKINETIITNKSDNNSTTKSIPGSEGNVIFSMSSNKRHSLPEINLDTSNSSTPTTNVNVVFSTSSSSNKNVSKSKLDPSKSILDEWIIRSDEEKQYIDENNKSEEKETVANKKVHTSPIPTQPESILIKKANAFKGPKYINDVKSVRFAEPEKDQVLIKDNASDNINDNHNENSHTKSSNTNNINKQKPKSNTPPPDRSRLSRFSVVNDRTRDVRSPVQSSNAKSLTPCSSAGKTIIEKKTYIAHQPWKPAIPIQSYYSKELNCIAPSSPFSDSTSSPTSSPTPSTVLLTPPSTSGIHIESENQMRHFSRPPPLRRKTIDYRAYITLDDVPLISQMNLKPPPLRRKTIDQRSNLFEDEYLQENERQSPPLTKIIEPTSEDNVLQSTLPLRRKTIDERTNSNDSSNSLEATIVPPPRRSTIDLTSEYELLRVIDSPSSLRKMKISNIPKKRGRKKKIQEQPINLAFLKDHKVYVRPGILDQKLLGTATVYCGLQSNKKTKHIIKPKSQEKHNLYKNNNNNETKDKARKKPFKKNTKISPIEKYIERIEKKLNYGISNDENYYAETTYRSRSTERSNKRYHFRSSSTGNTQEQTKINISREQKDYDYYVIDTEPEDMLVDTEPEDNSIEYNPKYNSVLKTATVKEKPPENVYCKFKSSEEILVKSKKNKKTKKKRISKSEKKMLRSFNDPKLLQTLSVKIDVVKELLYVKDNFVSLDKFDNPICPVEQSTNKSKSKEGEMTHLIQLSDKEPLEQSYLISYSKTEPICITEKIKNPIIIFRNPISESNSQVDAKESREDQFENNCHIMNDSCTTEELATVVTAVESIIENITESLEFPVNEVEQAEIIPKLVEMSTDVIVSISEYEDFRTVEPETVERETEPESVEREAIEPESVEREAIKPESVETETKEPESIERKTNEPESMEPETIEPESIEQETLEPESNEQETKEPESVERETIEPETDEPKIVELPQQQTNMDQETDKNVTSTESQVSSTENQFVSPTKFKFPSSNIQISQIENQVSSTEEILKLNEPVPIKIISGVGRRKKRRESFCIDPIKIIKTNDKLDRLLSKPSVKILKATSCFGLPPASIVENLNLQINHTKENSRKRRCTRLTTTHTVISEKEILNEQDNQMQQQVNEPNIDHRDKKSESINENIITKEIPSIQLFSDKLDGHRDQVQEKDNNTENTFDTIKINSQNEQTPEICDLVNETETSIEITARREELILEDISIADETQSDDIPSPPFEDVITKEMEPNEDTQDICSPPFEEVMEKTNKSEFQDENSMLSIANLDKGIDGEDVMLVSDHNEVNEELLQAPDKHVIVDEDQLSFTDCDDFHIPVESEKRDDETYFNDSCVSVENGTFITIETIQEVHTMNSIDNTSSIVKKRKYKKNRIDTESPQPSTSGLQSKKRYRQKSQKLLDAMAVYQYTDPHPSISDVVFSSPYTVTNNSAIDDLVKRKRGRPKLQLIDFTHPPKIIKTSVSTPIVEHNIIPIVKKRGRPKGSKNKKYILNVAEPIEPIESTIPVLQIVNNTNKVNKFKIKKQRRQSTCCIASSSSQRTEMSTRVDVNDFNTYQIEQTFSENEETNSIDLESILNKIDDKNSEASRESAKISDASRESENEPLINLIRYKNRDEKCNNTGTTMSASRLEKIKRKLSESPPFSLEKQFGEQDRDRTKTYSNNCVVQKVFVPPDVENLIEEESSRSHYTETGSSDPIAPSELYVDSLDNSNKVLQEEFISYDR